MSGGDKGANKRHQDRKNLVYFPRVYIVGEDEEFGRVIDITTEGMLIVRYNPAPQMGEYKLRVVWVAEDNEDDELTASAQVRWCKKDVNPDLWAVGLKFLALDAYAESEIRRLIRKWSFPEW